MASEKFHAPQTKALVAYVQKKYGRTLEFLWAKLPLCAIWRRADNDKWFGAVMTIPQNKIIPGAPAEMIEILDIRCAPDMLDFIVDKKKIFPGWHMNKNHWITVPLDGRLTLRDIYKLLDASYQIAGQK